MQISFISYKFSRVSPSVPTTLAPPANIPVMHTQTGVQYIYKTTILQKHLSALSKNLKEHEPQNYKSLSFCRKNQRVIFRNNDVTS